MKYEVYMSKRNELLDKAQNLIDESKVEDANTVMAEVTALDEQFDAEAKAEADMKALAGQQRKVNMQNINTAQVNGPVVDQTNKEVKAEDAFKTDAYKEAWAKVMMNKPLTTDEAKTFQMVNAAGSADAPAYTHTTENTPILIPETVANGIWKEIEERFPYYADVAKIAVKGKYTMIKAKESSEAKWYVESVKTEDGRELFDRYDLNGCELARAITVSWKLKEMAISDFISYIISSMAEQMGKALAYGCMHGAGIVEGSTPEPLGVITALDKESQKPQIVEYTGEVTYADLIQTRAKVKSGYKPAVYVNSDTMWNVLAAMTDENGRPLLMADASASGGVFRVLGCVVKEDDSMDDGEILFSDAKQYLVNLQKQITITTEEHNKERTTDYCGYAIADGAPVTNKAHALLRKNS